MFSGTSQAFFKAKTLKRWARSRRIKARQALAYLFAYLVFFRLRRAYRAYLRMTESACKSALKARAYRL